MMGTLQPQKQSPPKDYHTNWQEQSDLLVLIATIKDMIYIPEIDGLISVATDPVTSTTEISHVCLSTLCVVNLKKIPGRAQSLTYCNKELFVALDNGAILVLDALTYRSSERPISARAWRLVDSITRRDKAFAHDAHKEYPNPGGQVSERFDGCG